MLSFGWGSISHWRPLYPFVLCLFITLNGLVSSMCVSPLTSGQSAKHIQRRECLLRGVSAFATSLLILDEDGAAYAADSGEGRVNGLAAKLSKRDASALKNSVFNTPPAAQVYPPFLRGNWDVTMSFRGYLFPSTKIPKEKLTSNVNVPGFQKCSIAQTCDVGLDQVKYNMIIDPVTGFEDRVNNIQSSINAHLSFQAVEDVVYDAKANPNRISIDFAKYKTRNAERIELFCNARESELVSNASNSDDKAFFVCSEYIRQVTFSYSQQFGVARQVVGNYAHFWTWREIDDNHVTGNLLTAAYLDPQDPLFFDEPSKPVAVYSHNLSAVRRKV
jgi:hypothetical protein